MKKGVIELCILRLLSAAPNYGYGIAQQLESYNALSMKESTLYLILARLQKDKLISVKLRASVRGPKRRYFSLTSEGRARLLGMETYWRDFSSDVDQLLKGETT